MTDAGQASDNARAFVQALADKGYMLATGTRPYVLVDFYGGLHALPRLIGDNFRVLWVVDSQGRDREGKTRLENFIEVANEVTDGRISYLFLFTTYDAFKNDNPLTHTWVNAKGEGRSIIEV